jgi:hypothetical protein
VHRAQATQQRQRPRRLRRLPLMAVSAGAEVSDQARDLLSAHLQLGHFHH